jgi:hypothetical protein
MATNPRVEFGRRVFDYFVGRGLAPHQAAAIAGNMAWEGGGRTDLVNPGDNYRNSPGAPHSIGIAQWNDRSPALIQFARAQGIELPEGDLRDSKYAQDVIRRIPLETQLDFAWSEMQGSEGRALRNIAGAGDLRSATAGAIGYHRPAGWTSGNPEAGHGFMGRLSLANAIMREGPSAPQPADGMDDRTYRVTPEPQSAPPVARAAPPPAEVPFPLLGALSVTPTATGTEAQAKLAASAMQSAAAGSQEASMQPLAGAPQLRPEDLQRLRSMLMKRTQLGLA